MHRLVLDRGRKSNGVSWLNYLGRSDQIETQWIGWTRENWQVQEEIVVIFTFL